MEDDLNNNDYEADASVTLMYDALGANFALKKEGRGLSIPYCARHETLEVLVSDLFSYLENFYASKLCAKLRHETVHRLEKVLPLPTDREVGYKKK
jgi:Mn-dependent DtxR family transcriptional regulator